MQTTSIEPIIQTGQLQALEEQNALFLQQLEHHLPILASQMASLTDLMTQVVEQTPAWHQVLKDLEESGNHHILRLIHESNTILNLPWGLARNPQTQQTLGTQRRLVLTKCPARFASDGRLALEIISAPPLKILIQISSPDDSDYQNRLAYEEEEFLILEALAPLMESAQVEIDFTDDGSLEALKEKLEANLYHILHVSTHAVFQKGQGFLQLEHALSLKQDMVSAQAFADAVNCHADHCLPLVLLSCCQSAQGDTHQGLHGITNHLLRTGVRAVIGMGASVSDHYAIRFAGCFYQALALQQDIPSSFAKAQQFLREAEYQNQVMQQIPEPRALQWTIPNLYMRAGPDHLVDWSQSQQPLRQGSHRYVVRNQRLVLQHDDTFRFIGRRRDKATILPILLERKIILLRGQGGVGKTALTEHLIQRFIAGDAKTVPFVFTENTRSIQDILQTLRSYLIDHNEFDAAAFALLEKGLDQLRWLLARVGEICTPVFVFDNLETFQSQPGQPFAPEFLDVQEAIGLICALGRHHTILTARYPLPDLPEVQAFDLNQVGLNDFWRRCHQLGLASMARTLREQAASPGQIASGPRLQFIDIVRLLHQTFGGNYRALELFDKLYQQDPEAGKQALESLDAFRKRFAQESDEVRQAMAADLAFDTLLSLTEPRQIQCLRLLQHYRIPITEFALSLQMAAGDAATAALEADLLKLQEFTLAEISLDPDTQQTFYYVPPIVRDLLTRAEGKKVPGPPRPFAPQAAGAYHYHMFHNKLAPSLTELEEAFFHFCQARNAERINDIGAQISGYYYNVSLFQNALHCAKQSFDILAGQTSPSLLNRLGLIYRLYGDYDAALDYLQRGLKTGQEIGDRTREGFVLDHIGQIYLARGDHDTALKYSQRSLKELQKTGDRGEEGTTLNNIGEIYRARGDYDNALEYLQQSLKIRLEFGNRREEGTTLNNIGLIYDARGDYDTALDYLQQSLKIRQEIGDRIGEGGTLNNISLIYSSRGNCDTAIDYLQQSLTIRQEIGDREGEGITLGNIGEVYRARGNYDTALDYLQKSLKIGQEIGDRVGEGRTLNCISLINSSRGDYDSALNNLQQSLTIQQEIGDKPGMIPTLHNMATIAAKKKDMKQEKEYEIQAYRLAQETGDAKGLFHTGTVVGRILCSAGQKDEGLKILRHCHQIGKQSGIPGVEQLEQRIREWEQA